MNPLVEVLMTAFHPARTSEYTPKFGTPIQKAALAVGAVFVAVGVLGFVPGITTNYDQLTFVEALVFGLALLRDRLRRRAAGSSY